MLPSLQYTDFHKFLVSVGGAVCGIGIGLPVLLLRSQAVFKTSAADLAKLTPEARSGIEAQQRQISFLLHFWPYFTSAMLLLGLGFVAWGAVSWKRQQNRSNDREAAEIEKLQIENEKTYHEVLALAREHQASPKEVEQASEEKIAEALEPSDRYDEEPTAEPPKDRAAPGEPGQSKEESQPPRREEQSESSPTLPDYFEPKLVRPRTNVVTFRPSASSEAMMEFSRKIVKRVTDGFARAYAPLIDIVPEISFGDTYSDAIIMSKSKSVPDMVVGIKLVGNTKNARARLRDSIIGGLKAAQAAQKELGISFTPTIFLIVDDFPINRDRTVEEARNTERRLASVAKIVNSEMGDLSELTVPMNIVVATFDSLESSEIRKLDWRTPSPRVIVLG